MILVNPMRLGLDWENNLIGINEKALEAVKNYGLDIEFTKESVELNIHNTESMVYYILNRGYEEKEMFKRL